MHFFNCASKMFGFILHTLSKFDLVHSSLTILNSLIHLEYCSVIWSLSHNCDCFAIGKVQRNSTRCLYFEKKFRRVDYPTRHHTLNLLLLSCAERSSICVTSLDILLVCWPVPSLLTSSTTRLYIAPTMPKLLKYFSRSSTFTSTLKF